MVDEPDDATTQQQTLRGVGADHDQGLGEAATVALPPARPSATELQRTPPWGGSATRSLGPRQPRDTGAPAALDGSRYTLGSLIGEGGMGEVVLAYDEQIGREVAVKRIRSANPSEDELSRFVREARVQGRLEHPAVVPVHDLATDPAGRPYFVMKRLSGTVMSDVLARLRADDEPDPELARRRLLRAFADVCLAVEFAHSRGIIHRDLKPANIMLGDFGEVYVLDWGIARAVTEPEDTGTPPSGQHDLKLASGDTRVGTVLGTPAYMAPEQVVGDRAGPLADVYALGCILFEIAAGEPLHHRARSVGQALTQAAARPSRCRPDAPPELDVICERACAVELAERFSSARALGNAVQAYLDGDRDLAVRRELAAHHLAQARGQLAAGDGDEARRAAMQAAGRALALDPTATEAGDIITRLMLEPPKAVPQEVEHRIAVRDTETARAQGRLAAASMIGYLAFLPFLAWTGIRDFTLIPVFALLAVASGLQVYALTRQTGTGISRASIYLNTCINAVLIGIVSRMVGPFIIAPTLVLTTLMAYAAHPQFGRMKIVSVILAAGVAVPWGLELAGVLSPTYRFEDGAIILTSPIVRFSPVPVQLAFAVLLLALIAVVAVLSRGLSKKQREAARKLELQAWHLRQIVPETTR